MMPVSPSRRAPRRRPIFAVARVLALPAFALALFSSPVFATAQTTPAPPADSTSSQPEATPTPSPVAVLPTAPANKRQLQAAADAYLNGARALDHKNLAAAETQFSKAVSLNPRNSEYAVALALTREHHVTELVQQAGKARLLGHNDAADALIAQARALDPQNAIVTQHIDPGPLPSGFTPSVGSPDSIQTYSGPITLLPANAPQSFHLRSDVKQVVTEVATQYGIRTVFDPSVVSQSLRFDLDDTRYPQAMPILLDMARLFAVPLDAHSIFVAKDTLENRQRLERQLEETIYIPALTQEQMAELSNVVRNIFDLKQVTVQNNIGTMIVRAPESVLSALNLTLADLIDGGSQVMLDLKLYSVDKSRSRNIGAALPQQIGVYNVQSAAQNLVAANQTLVNQAIAQGLVPAGSTDVTIALALIASGLVQSTLLSNTIGFFGGGITQTGVTTNANPTFSLALNASDTRILDDVQLRMADRQSATFRAGTRYPITTSTYSFTAANTASSALSGVTINGVSAASLLASVSSVTVPQISFEDLGITLKATPTVQKSNNVTLHLDFKIEALTGGVINNIPILASRQFTSDITIADGQTALMVSSLSKTESGAVSGIPGLGELPGFQSTVSDNTTQLDSSDLVLLITPHIVRRRSSIISGPRIALNLPSTVD
jgi:general secretion pathway protein D